MAREKIRPEDVDPPKREKIRPEDVGPVLVPQRQLSTPSDTDVLPTQDPELRQPPALMMGAGKGASLGFIDEISGLTPEPETVEKAINPLGMAGRALTRYFSGDKPLDEVQASDVKPSPTPKSYTESRDDYRGQEHRAKELNPKQFLAGELAGGMMVPMPGGAGARGLKKVAYSALTGGALGGVAGVGTSEGNTAGEVALDGLKGAGAGALISGGLSGAGVGVRKLMGSGETRALKAVGAIQKDLSKLSQEEQDRLGRAALDEKVFGFGTGKQAIKDRAEALAKQSGEEIGSIIDKASATPERTSGPRLYGEIAALTAAKPPVAARAPYNSSVLAEAEALGSGQKLSASDVAARKRTLDDLVNHAKRGVDMEPIQNQARGDVAGVYRKAEEDLVERALGPDELRTFREAKSRFGAMDEIADLAKKGVDRESGNNVFGLGSTIGAAAAGASGFAGNGVSGGISGLAAGAAVAAAIKVAKERGDSAAAVFLESVGHGKLRHLVHALSAANIRSTPATSSRLLDYFSGEKERGR